MTILSKDEFQNRLTSEEISKVLELSEKEPMFYALLKTYELCETINTLYIAEILRVLEVFEVITPGRDKDLMA